VRAAPRLRLKSSIGATPSARSLEANICSTETIFSQRWFAGSKSSGCCELFHRERRKAAALSNRNTRNRAPVGCLSAPGERFTIKSAAAVSAGARHAGRGAAKARTSAPCCDFSQLPTLGPIGQSERGYPPASVAPAGGITHGDGPRGPSPSVTGAPRRGAEKYRSVEGRAGQSFGACIANVAILQRRAQPHASFRKLLSSHANASGCLQHRHDDASPDNVVGPPVHVLPSRSVLVTPAMCE